MAPSPLYAKLHTLAKAHATGDNLLGIRAPDARHRWGHNRLVSLNPTLQDNMDNAAFAAHLKSTGRLIDMSKSAIHNIMVDEHQRKASIRMSYFLNALGSNEIIEQDLIWILKFTDESETGGDIDKILITESIEFIDATASARLGEAIKSMQGDLAADVRGGVGITLN